MDSKRWHRPRAPIHVVWLATRACALRCAHCTSKAGQRDPSELTTEEARTLVTELAEAGVVDLAISGGEPLLRSDIGILIRHAKERGLVVGLGTSGFDAARHVPALAAAGLDRLQVSVDGRAAAHDALRRRIGQHAEAVEVIRRAVGAGLRTDLCCTLHAGNAGDVDFVVELAMKLGVRRVNFSRFVPTGRGDLAFDMPPEHWRRVVERCHRLQAALMGRLHITTHLAQLVLIDPALGECAGFAGCQAGRGQGCVDADGTVFPCVRLPVGIGNVRLRPFMDIWVDSRLIRQLNDRAQLRGACGKCVVRESCGGCRGVAYATNGDPMGPDPRCWAAPRQMPALWSARKA